MSWTAEQALDHWEHKKLITPKKRVELEASLHGKEVNLPNRAIGIFAAVGGILVGLGMILFVGSHWTEMTPVLRVAILVVSLVITGWLGFHLVYVKKTYEKTGMSLLFVNALLYGASIFLVAQIYNLPLTFWWGALLWLIGTVYMAYVLKSKMHMFLAVPLLVLFIGWLHSSVTSGFLDEFDFLFSDRQSIVSLLPVLGLGLASLGILHRAKKGMEFGARTLFNWGILIVLLLITVSTIDKEVLYHWFAIAWNPVSIAVVAASLLAFVCALSFGKFQTNNGRSGLIALALYLLFIYVIAYIPQWFGFPGYDGFTASYYGTPDSAMLSGLFVLHVVLAFVFLLAVVWFGTLMHEAGVVNMGMMGIAVIILIQYFSWAYEMLPRSMFFIVGGLIILSFSTVLERKRREILSGFQS